jgi:hypothetical protein
MILKHGMTDDEILNEIKNEMKQKEIEQTDKNTNETLKISKQILEMMNNDTEIELVLQKGLRN